MNEIEITQADRDLAGWFTRRMDGGGLYDEQAAKLIAKHRHEARAEALDGAAVDVHGAIFDCAMRHNGKASAADYSMDAVRAIRALRSGEREGAHRDA